MLVFKLFKQGVNFQNTKKFENIFTNFLISFFPEIVVVNLIVKPIFFQMIKPIKMKLVKIDFCFGSLENRLRYR